MKSPGNYEFTRILYTLSSDLTSQKRLITSVLSKPSNNETKLFFEFISRRFLIPFSRKLVIYIYFVRVPRSFPYGFGKKSLVPYRVTPSL